MTELEEIERTLSSDKLIDMGIERIPEWALPILINYELPESEEERVAINKFRDAFREYGYKTMLVCPVEETVNPYFTRYPAFGLPCDVVDCKIILDLR